MCEYTQEALINQLLFCTIISLMKKLNSEKKYDAEWYFEFKEIGSFYPQSYFNGDRLYREKQKKLFIEGKIRNPKLDYPKLNPELFKAKSEQLKNLKKRIQKEEPNPTVKQAYFWKIEEKAAQLRLLAAASICNMEEFMLHSEFIYKNPSKELFACSIQSILEKTHKGLISSNPNLQYASKNLRDTISHSLPNIKSKNLFKYRTLPIEERSVSMDNIIQKDLQKLIDFPKTKKLYNAQDIEEAFQFALKQMQAYDWEVEIDENSHTAISVNQEFKRVTIPVTRRLTYKKLQGLILHEIGTHVARRIHGEKSPLMLLGLGLSRFERGDEGVATVREQGILHRSSFPRQGRHLAIGLAIGLDEKPRDFRDVYDIIEKYLIFHSVSMGKNYDDAKIRAQINAWTICVRTFRGTDCSTPGACYTKDIIYQEGNLAVWDLLQHNSREATRFNIGKYDPANPRHIWILNKLKLFPE